MTAARHPFLVVQLASTVKPAALIVLEMVTDESSAQAAVIKYAAQKITAYVIQIHDFS